MKPYQLMKVEFLVTGCFLTYSVLYFEKCDMMSLGSGTLTKYTMVGTVRLKYILNKMKFGMIFSPYGYTW